MKEGTANSLWDEPLPPDEFERLVARALADLDGPEGEEMASFMARFKRRYPTPLARLRFSTRYYRQSMKLQGTVTKLR
jgi:hypothetical protein